MTELRKGLRAAGLALVLLSGSSALSACTGERPTLSGRRAPTRPLEQPDCPAVSFHYPGSEMTPQQWTEHYMRQNEFAELTLTEQQRAQYYDELAKSTSFKNSAEVINQIFAEAGIRVTVGKVPSQLKDRPDEITQHLLDVSAQHVLDAYSRLPMGIAKIIKEHGGLEIYLTTGIHKQGEADTTAYYLNGTGPKWQDQLALDVGPSTDTGDAFIWGLAHVLAPRLCAYGSTFEQFASYNPDGFIYGMTEVEVRRRNLTTAFAEPSVTNVHEDFDATLEDLLKRGLDGDCRTYSEARYLDPDIPVHDTGHCKKGRYVLRVLAASDKKAAQYMAVPYYYTNGRL